MNFMKLHVLAELRGKAIAFSINFLKGGLAENLRGEGFITLFISTLVRQIKYFENQPVL